MAISITLETNLNKRIEEILSRIKNKKPFFRKAELIMRKDILDHFNQEKGPQANWRRLSDIYGKRKKRLFGNKKILELSGRLKKQATDKPTITDESLTFKTNLEYAPAHQFGFKNIPARPFLWLSRDFTDKVVQLGLKEIYGK